MSEGEDGRLNQWVPFYFDVIDSKLFKEMSGDTMKLYCIMRRYVCRARSGHSLSEFYRRGYLAVEGYLGTWASVIGKSNSTISRSLSWLEQHNVISCYHKSTGTDDPSVYILGIVLHIAGSNRPEEIFFLDHYHEAQEDHDLVRDCELPTANAVVWPEGPFGIADEFKSEAELTIRATLAPMQGSMQGWMQGRVQGSNREDIIEKSNNVSAHSRVRPLPEEDLEDLQYVDLDEEEGVTRPKWQIPDTLGQREFLAVSGAKWFKSGQKSKVKALLRAFNAGDVLGDRAYSECARAIEDVPDFTNRELPPLPRSWYEWRLEQAKEHRWSVNGFIKALYNRDALMRHCQIHMKKSATTAPAGKMENGAYIIEIPEGGPR